MSKGFRTTLYLALFAACAGIGHTQTVGDYGIVGGQAPTVQDAQKQAWSELDDSFGAKKQETRIQALNALSLLGGNTRAEDMVRSAMKAPEIDVQLAAIIAAGQMEKDHPHAAFSKELHQFLASDDPKLSFTAADALWTLHNTSGEDVLAATAAGERAADYGFLKRSEHNADQTLHDPAALAKIAMMQSLEILVPPVGMGMGAYGYLKGSSGPSPQVTAIEALAKVHTSDVQNALIGATKAKDAAARIAAAEALSKFSGPAVRDALYPLLSDDKEQVRLTASAAYLRVTGATPQQTAGARSPH